MCRTATLLVLAALAGQASATFRAGAHAVDITPRTLPIVTSGNMIAARAERIDTPLNARALALDDGTSRVVIAAVDSLMMPREFIDRIKEAAARKTGIPASRMLISATHTHSAPPVMGALGTDNNPEYAAFVEPRVVEVIEGAVRNLRPARIGWAVVDVPEYTHNRRWILRPDKMRQDPFGGLTVRANMHPGYQNPDFIGPSGPVDPALSVVALRSPEGRPIALLANYSMHYVGYLGRVVSPDYYGHFAEEMQRLVGAEEGGPPFVAMMSQGTAGDLHWMDYSRPKQEMDVRTYAGIMARIAYNAWGGIEYRDRAPIAMAETKLRLARRVPDAARMAWAKEMMARMGGAPPRNQPEVYAREQTYLAAEPERELILQALRIGELGIAAIPNEVFAITGLKIKAQSPLRPTVNIELANGAEGYIPPPEQLALGGYTSWPARTAGLEINAEPKIAETVLKLLEQVAGKPRRAAGAPEGPYVKSVLASKPMAYWRGGEFGGPAARDASRNGIDAVYEGGVAFFLPGPPGVPGRSPHYAGGRMRAGAMKLGNRYSVAMWFNSGMPTDARAIAGTLFSSGAGRLVIGGTARAQGKLLFTGGGAAFEGTTVLERGNWHHLVFVRAGNRVSVYLDGKTTPELSGDAAATPPVELFIAGDDPSSGFEGRIGEVAVFDRPLRAEEIARHFAAR